MKNFAIICEYNPFHFGHEYQISELKKQGGTVTAVMSGDVCQRGEFALIGKYERAKMALAAGADLVLELPFPYSAAGAEKFAFGCIDIISRLGFADELSFGSECGKADAILTAAKRVNSASFAAALRENFAENGKKPYGKLYFDTYNELFGDDGIFAGSNNILGVAYASQIIKRESPLGISTVKRVGEDYNGEGKGLSSASTIRKTLSEKGIGGVENMLPKASFDLLAEEWEKGNIIDAERVFTVFSSFLRTSRPSDISTFAENDISLASRLINAGNEATNMEELICLASTKKYSRSHIRRALMFSYFCVTREMLCAPPAYTVLLGADKTGCELLARAKKEGSIPVITKPADFQKYGEDAKKAFELARKVSSVRLLSQKTPGAASEILKKTPCVLR